MELRQSSGGIISVLCSQRSTTQKELAEAIDKDQTTVVRMIQSMERKRDCKEGFE